MANKIYADKKLSVVFFTLFLLWWIIMSFIQRMVLLNFGFHPSKAFADGIISNALLAGACLLVINNMRYYLPKREKYWYVFIITMALSLLWLLAMRVSLWWLFKNDSAYLFSLAQTSFIRFVIAFLMIGCSTLLSLVWYTQKDGQDNQERKEDMERLAKDAELNKLRQQLQPHFLFNSLNSISALTGSQPEKARHMIQQLSDFLRVSLKKEKQQLSSLGEELQYLQLYLDIEKVRFGYRLQTNIDIEDDCMDMQLPSLMLQPLVENAIKFGLYDTIGEVTIFINVKKQNNMLQVSIQNPFDEATSTPLKGTGFGLSSIGRRLLLLYGRTELLIIKKEAQQFITTINIPQQHDSNTN